jgi:acyl carrier protein
MANPLPNEKELYTQITQEHISVAPDIWDLLYTRVGDDISAINLLCQYHLNEKTAIPVIEAKKILTYTRHIKDIVNQLSLTSTSEFKFPEFSQAMPLHPVIRDMFTHYIGNDVYMINLIVRDALDPLAPQDVHLESVKKIMNHARSIKEFINRLSEATLARGSVLSKPGEEAAATDAPAGTLTREAVFLRLCRLLAHEFHIRDENTIQLRSRFREDLGLDSIEGLQVVMLLEEEFGFEIPDEDVDRILTIGHAVDYALKRLRR